MHAAVPDRRSVRWLEGLNARVCGRHAFLFLHDTQVRSFNTLPSHVSLVTLGFHIFFDLRCAAVLSKSYVLCLRAAPCLKLLPRYCLSAGTVFEPVKEDAMLATSHILLGVPRTLALEVRILIRRTIYSPEHIRIIKRLFNTAHYGLHHEMKRINTCFSGPNNLSIAHQSGTYPCHSSAPSLTSAVAK
jgi:hypothetical protein